MKCPMCGEDNNRVVDSRQRKTLQHEFYRMRKCLSCGKRFSTRERYCPDILDDTYHPYKK